MKKCPYCAEEIQDAAVVCKHCRRDLLPSSSNPAPSAAKVGHPLCQHCGGSMEETIISSGNCSGIVIALIVFCVGVVIFFSIPVIGWILGPIISIGALFMGGKRAKVWKCKACGAVVNRA